MDPMGKIFWMQYQNFQTLFRLLSSLKGFSESSQKWVKSTYPINLLKFNRTGGFTSYRLLTLTKGKTHLNCIFVVYCILLSFLPMCSLLGFYWNWHAYEFFRNFFRRTPAKVGSNLKNKRWLFVRNAVEYVQLGDVQNLTLNIFHGNSKGAAFKIPCFFNILFITCFALVSPLFTKYFIFWVPDGKTCIYLYI